jgi:hypothetical protein
MAYDFPNSPTENQEYTPPVGGQTYIYKSPHWVVKSAAVYTKTEADTKFVDTAGDSMSGSLTVQPVSGNANLVLDKSGTDQQSVIYGRSATEDRWLMMLGNGVPESGGNAGSNFTIQRCDDNGEYLNTAISIDRSTGIVAFETSPIAPTPAPDSADTSIATTAFVTAAIAAIPPPASGATIADAAPAGTQGMMWWNSANGNLYIYYMDGTSNQWVQVNSVGM